MNKLPPRRGDERPAAKANSERAQKVDPFVRLQAQRERKRLPQPEKKKDLRGVKSRARSRGKRRSSKKKKNNRKRGERGFSVWRSVSLLPRFTWASVLSSLLFLIFAGYVGLVVHQAQEQLEINLSTKGVNRIYHAHQEMLMTLEKDRPPQKVTVIDARPNPVWDELGERFGRALR